MRRALVTGGAGFIGSHIVERLLADGAEVVVFDNFSTGSRKNLASFQGPLEVKEADLRDPEALADALRGCEVVFHQGALPSVARSVEDPEASIDVNVRGTLNLLQAAVAEAACRRVVFASSSSVYGDTEVLPKVETMPVAPLSPYAASKVAGEALMRAYNHSMGIETACLRYFNVFGPRQSAKSQYAAVIPNFVAAMAAGQPPKINGDGHQTRDFTFVGDVVRANLLAATVPEAAGAVMNVAPGSPTSVLDLARRIAEAVGYTGAFDHGPARAGDVRHSHADSNLARDTMGWTAKTTFEQGLDRTLSAAGARS